MDTPAPDILIKILRDCAGRGAEPIYPADYAQTIGLERAALDHALDRLRTSGWLQLTDWTAGKGQGYTITEEGKEALAHPQLERLMDLAGKHQSTPAKPVAPERLTPWDRGEAVIGSLTEIPPPVVTMTLIVLNLVMFLVGGFLANRRGIDVATYLSGNAPALALLDRDLGALNSFDTLVKGEWWRLFTHQFLHGGLFHLFMNMYALFSIGPLLESMWGRWRYLYLYLVSGMVGGVAVVMGQSSALGASGAICGLLTSMVCWIWLNRAHLGPELSSRWLRSIFINIGLIALISLIPQVSTLGHLGGGISGLLLGLPMVYQRFGTPWQRRLGLCAMLLVPALAAGLCLGLEQIRGEELRAALKELRAEEEREEERTRFRSAAQLFIGAERKAQEAVVDIALPLLKEGKLPADTDDDRQTMINARQALREAMAQIEQTGPYRDADMAEGQRLMLQYLDASAELLDRCATAVGRPKDWSREVRNELAEQFARREQLQKTLIANRSVREIGRQLETKKR